MNKHLFVFPDTNTALHFRRADEIDWLSAAGAQHVTLVITTTYVQELDQQKVGHPAKRLRDRAAATISWLKPLMRSMDPTELRPGVDLVFRRTEPLIDFESRRLNPKLADDRLIATVLEFAQETEADVAVATDDGGMEMKLPAFGLADVPLPESARLADEPDPIQRDNLELRRKVASFENRTPRPELRFAGAEPVNVMKFRVPTAFERPDDLATIRDKYPLEKIPDVPDVPALRGSADLSRFSAPIFTEISQKRTYNGRLEAYYGAYAHYLDAWDNWVSYFQRTLPISLLLTNTGTAPATNIDIRLAFPNSVTLSSFDDAPRKPKPPSPPKHGEMSAGYGVSRFGDRYAGGGLRFPTVFNDGDATFGADGKSVHFWLRDLKQHEDFGLEIFAMTFDTVEAVNSVGADYILTANELPDRLVGKLHLARIDS